MNENQDNHVIRPIEIDDRVELIKSVQKLGIIYQAGLRGKVTEIFDSERKVVFEGIRGSPQVQERYLKKL